MINKMKGPIAVFGAGGFVGVNLMQVLLKERSDVVGFSRDPGKAWRLRKASIDKENIVSCNLLNRKDIASSIKKYQPKTIFNLAAYGAYSKQKDIEKIHATNFLSTVNLIEMLKQYGFSAYVHAGSQSEYGLNSKAPKEIDELVPNSHYAVSKAAVYYLLKYYGKVEKLPVVHLRLYSVYGPYEEPDRLIPTLIRAAKKGKLPRFADPDNSRDFIYIDDVVRAIIKIAPTLKPIHYGEAFNIATGKKTTLRELAAMVKRVFNIKEKPVFKSSLNRPWEVKDWYGNPKKMEQTFGWKAKVNLEAGLKMVYLS